MCAARRSTRRSSGRRQATTAPRQTSNHRRPGRPITERKKAVACIAACRLLVSEFGIPPSKITLELARAVGVTKETALAPSTLRKWAIKLFGEDFPWENMKANTRELEGEILSYCTYYNVQHEEARRIALNWINGVKYVPPNGKAPKGNRTRGKGTRGAARNKAAGKKANRTKSTRAGSRSITACASDVTACSDACESKNLITLLKDLQIDLNEPQSLISMLGDESIEHSTSSQSLNELTIELSTVTSLFQDGLNQPDQISLLGDEFNTPEPMDASDAQAAIAADAANATDFVDLVLSDLKTESIVDDDCLYVID